MNQLKILVKRNFKEFLRDPISFIFCLLFPIVMLVLLQTIFTQIKNIPSNFAIENYATGICVFGYTFDMLMVAIYIANDKNTEFINRIYIAPLKKYHYLLSYIIAMLPVVLLQTLLFFSFSLIFGLPFGWNLLLAILYLLPSALLYLSFGVLFGVLCKNEKQAGPISSIVISLVGIFGGIFMPIGEMGVFSTVLHFLPFVHSIEIASEVFSGELLCFYPHILWLVGYGAVLWIVILLLHRRKK